MKFLYGKKGFLKLTFFLITFLVLWAGWLGPFLQVWGEQAVTDNALSGFEAWFYMNINLFIGILYLVCAFVGYYVGGQQQ